MWEAAVGWRCWPTIELIDILVLASVRPIITPTGAATATL